jgi:hypothetical protein
MLSHIFIEIGNAGIFYAYAGTANCKTATHELVFFFSPNHQGISETEII